VNAHELIADEGAARLAATPESSGRRGAVFVALAAGAFAIAFLAMPIAYDLVSFHGAVTPVLHRKVLIHLTFNCAANFIVMMVGLRASGRLDQRLSEVFAATLIAHGVLAFFTLVTRHFYSIPMMVLGGGASLVLGSAITFARGRIFRVRVGLLGPWHPVAEDPNIDCRRLDAWTTDLSGIDLILITADHEPDPATNAVLLKALLLGKRVRHVSEFMEEARRSCDVELFDIDAVSFSGVTRFRMAKRALDVVLVLVTAPVGLTVIAIAAVGVFISMGRPIFFVQPRVGLAGREFNIFKLRTMRAARQGEGGATLAADPRVTPLGRFLRRFRIDEVPQLLNVLRGDMSVIGPRPEWTPLAQAYAAQEPKYVLRQLVRPGITGWAQVNAGPAADLAETRVKLGYDFFYLKHISLTLDLQILVRTFVTLLAGGGVR
jgi:lipopolysaccharide/colanic/teichoic acid biosynthesis glycosyltransferase